MNNNKKVKGGIREFLTVVSIAVLIAAVMTLLAAVPPLSILYRWLEERRMQHLWTALVAGVIGGALSFYRIKEEKGAE